MSVTAAIAVAGVVAFAITGGLGFVIIPWLHKVKFGQTILDIGPSWHKKKQGTPNMGGLMFIIGITVAFAVGAVFLQGWAVIWKRIIPQYSPAGIECS